MKNIKTPAELKTDAQVEAELKTDAQVEAATQTDTDTDKVERVKNQKVRIGPCSGKPLPPRPATKSFFYISMELRNKIEGYICILPFILGTIAFFLYPIALTIKLSLGKVVNKVGFVTEWLGFDNYVEAFFINTQFIPKLLAVMKNTIIKTPLIIVFALLLAIMINKNIKGKGFFRVVFFLPFLLGTGDVMNQLVNLGVDTQVLSIADSNLLPTELLNYLGDSVLTWINNFFNIIVLVLWNSGVQILLFLSGLQSISSSLYEAAKVDGATEWEMFWKVTVPMISPIMLLNVIYTVVDSFIAFNNDVLVYIKQNAFVWTKFEFAAAMGWIYFICILAFVGLVALLLRGYTKNFSSTGMEKQKRRVSRG